MSGQVRADDMRVDIQKEGAVTLELSVSDDGRSIVDQGGKEVARFNEGCRVSPVKPGVQKLQGCMCCRPECLIYDEERCVKWVRSCTWDFDCSCGKYQ